MELGTDKKIAIFILGLILTGLGVSLFFPKEEKRNAEASIRIGAGNDISGILMEETVGNLSDIYAVSENLESSSFQDC